MPYVEATLLLLVMLGDLCVGVHYANQWTVTIDGGDAVADSIATSHGFVNLGKLFKDENIYMFTHNQVMKRSLRHSDEHHSRLMSHRAVRSVEQQVIKKRVKRNSGPFNPDDKPSDPLWSETWYLLPGASPSMKVVDAWQAGYTGKDVVVTILDDGIEYKHPDLAANYDPLASKDVNDADDDPAPRPTYNNENRHGTRCAGEVAAVVNNNQCSSGIAYDAKIGGVRMLDGQVTDMVEARSIGLRPEHIDIYSASWGPDDDGRTVDGPAIRAKQAFEKGIKQGRGGKGSIFVWASGNGGRKSDNCNCDGYTNSIFTLSISSTTQNTNKPWYSEDCSSTLATTYSSGVTKEKQIVTTDLDGKCTTKHTGTSASAPLAAGICALALEANRNLTWRDMQHLVVRTANPESLKGDAWVTNAVGRKVSHSYGYGLMDAYAMVTLAKTWKTVPAQRRCNITVIKEGSNLAYGTENAFVKTFTVSGCEGVMPDKLEHVQAVISASSTRRGDMYIYLTSAQGTKSTLLDARILDDRANGFTKWPFMTTHYWDEDPNGQWKLEIQTKNKARSSTGFVTYFELVMYGTKSEEWPEGLVNSVTHADQGRPSSEVSTVEDADQGDRDVEGLLPAQHNIETTTSGCKTQGETGLCLACKTGYILRADHQKCVRECPKGQFIELKKADYETVGKKTGEELWEDQQQVRFEDEERFSGIRVCKMCAAGPYCSACTGPTVYDCTECVSGFEVRNGQCVLQSYMTQSQKVYALTIAVCVLAVVVFMLLFLFLHFCWSRDGSGYCVKTSSMPQYSYVPNDVDDNNLDKTTVEYVNGRNRPNGVSSGLLDDSDDDRA